MNFTKQVIATEREMASSPDNLYYTGEKLGHSPSDEEAIVHLAEQEKDSTFLRLIMEAAQKKSFS